MKFARLSSRCVLIKHVRLLNPIYTIILLSFVLMAGVLPQQLFAQDVGNSVIFNSADGSYLSRTPAIAGNRKTWTWSGWVKRANLGANQYLFQSFGPGGYGVAGCLVFGTDDRFDFIFDYNGGSRWRIITKQAFRDLSIWQHVVLIADTSNASSTDRLRLYIDGARITDFSVENYPIQNANGTINQAYSHRIGSYNGSAYFLDAYLSDVHFIDGQALAPDHFGEADPITGKWVPKSYTGTFGANGFHLNFADGSNLGKDVSDNSNDWVAYNINTADWVIDTPTNNFALLDVLDKVGTIILSNGNLAYSVTSGSQIRANMGAGLTGKWYWEIINGTTAGPQTPVAFGLSTVDGQITNNTTSLQKAISIYTDGGSNYTTFYRLRGIDQGSIQTQFRSANVGDIFQVAYDADTGKVWFGKNNVWYDGQNGISGDPENDINPVGIIPTGDIMVPFFLNLARTYSGTLNSGQGADSNSTYYADAGGYFRYQPPTGYKAISTKNYSVLPITNPHAYFDVVTYAGSGVANAITGLDFTPNLVWIKQRTGSGNHQIHDSVRGASLGLHSDSTQAEAADTDFNSFDLDGFSVSGNNDSVNLLGHEYVAWAWKEDPAAGFDIVSYTGDGNPGRTVSHDLGTAPELIIIKGLDNTDHWFTYHADNAIPADNYMYLNSTSQVITGGVLPWNQTVPSNVNITLGSDGGVNGSGTNYIAYLFASINGFSKIGSYTGNGSADGPFIFTGFKPAFVMIKRTDAAAEWVIYDVKRPGYNPARAQLRANASDAENTNSTVDMDLVSNGIKIRTADAAQNASGGSYVYMSFAEETFISGESVDETPPQLSEIYAVPAVTTNTSPAYSFHTTEGGSLHIGGSCSSDTTTALRGDNTIILSLQAGTYSDCTISVTDDAGNVSDQLVISAFTIDPNYQYTITNALEFNSGNNEYLSWTPTQVGNMTTWTWSAWVQRGELGTVNTLLYVSDGSQAAYVRFNSNNELEVALGDGSMHSYQSDLFSNSGIWSQISLSVDTTQADASDRIRLYLNGQLLTPLDGYIDPQQNALTLVNSTNTHYVGNGGGSNYYDGSMAEVRLIDGMALDASAFGKETSQGAWVPIEYTSGGGSNSSYLNFENDTNLGMDAANDNDWQVTGLDSDSQTSTTPTNPGPAGFIPGELSVGQGGDATYSIPIGVPQGVAGMQPELSINYNSNGGNGLLGMGFSLGGGSTIYRCGGTQVQDGFRGGVYLSGKDRFCMDGQRLIAISGSDGGDGTEYRTEIDSFTRIVSYGLQGSGPSYWKVWTKSGQTIEFGNTEDSRVEVVGKQSVRLWAVNRISDAVDNQILYSYNKDSGSGEFNLNEITYSNVTVQFQYQDRNDVYAGFSLGGNVKSSKRLIGVASSVNGQLVKKYTLDYKYSEVTGRSKLYKVHECDSEGNCFLPIKFNYEAPSVGLATSLVHTGGNFDSYAIFFKRRVQDVNNDGFADLVVSYGMKIAVFLGVGNGSFSTTPVVSNLTRCSSDTDIPGGVQLEDINADGFADVAYAALGDAARVCVHFGYGNGAFSVTGNGTTTNQPKTVLGEAVSYENKRATFEDFNGDGYIDVLMTGQESTSGSLTTIRPQAPRIYSGNGSGTFTDVGIATNISITSLADINKYSGYDGNFYDLNGDGLADYVLTNTNNVTVMAFLSQGNSNELATSPVSTTLQGSWAYENYDRRFVDVNGDGVLDYVFTKRSEFIAYVFIGHGDGRFESTPITTNINGSGWSDQLYTSDFIDMDGDGVNDLVMMARNSGTIHIFRGTGEGTFALSPTSIDVVGTFDDEDYERQFGDVNNDGKMDYVLIRKNAVHFYTSLSKLSFDRVTEISGSLGDSTYIEYKPLSDSSVYTRGSGVSYPEVDLVFPSYVVNKVTTPDGLGGSLSTSYKYGGLKVNVLGRGSLGFAWMQATDDQTGIVTKTEYSQTFPYVGQVTRTEQRLSDGTLLGETTASFNQTTSYGGKVYFPYTEQTVDKKYDLDGSLLATTTTDNIYDAFANPTRITITTVDSADTVIQDTVSDYINDTDVWHLGRLTRTSVTHSNSQGSITRTSAFDYNTDGLLQTEIIEPDNPDLRLQTDYQYDGYGNKTQVTTSGQGIETRSSSTTYTADGRFPETVKNALNHTETRVYDPLLGVMTSLTGPNQLTTSWSYDGFGRQIREDRADGTWTSVTRGQCGVTDCPEDAPEGTGLYTITESSGSTPVMVFSDQLGRETRKVTTGFDGTLIYEDTEYNHLGQIERKSQPYFKGGTLYWANSEYDILGRVKKVSQQGPNGTIENTFTYSGYSTIASNAKGHVKTTRKNAQDQVVRVDEEEGGWVTYRYDAVGNLLETDANDVITTLSYDLRGNKRTMDDPDMGHWSYGYDVLGQLTSQTDASGITVTMNYDKLGRMLQRVEPEGTSTWTYDTAANGIGSLAQVDAPDGYQQILTYDGLGRASTVAATADGRTLTTTTEYDGLGRVSRTIRPEGFVLNNVYNDYGYLKAIYSPSAQIGDYDRSHIRFLLETAISDAETALTKAQEVAAAAAFYQQKAEEYSQLSGTPDLDPELEAQLQSIAAELDAAAAILNGQAETYLELAEQLVEVAEQLYAREQILQQRYAATEQNDNISEYQAMADDSANVYFWRAKSRDAAGRLVTSVVGNGLETHNIYDQATGQLTDIISSFGYATPTRDLHYEYDDLNNVSSRVDRVLGMSESFEYDRQDRLTQSYVSGQIGETDYDYTVNYSYDAKGNMLNKSDIGDYTYGDQGRSTGNAGPHALLSAGVNHTGYQYDLNGNMLQGGGRNITWSSFNKPTEFRKDGVLKASFKYGPDRARYLKVTPDSRTLYLDKVYERIETGAKIEHKHFIYADGQLVAIHVKTTNEGTQQPDQTRYLHRDSLGSIDTITDGQGRIVDRMSYEPFGARRGGDWRVGIEALVLPALTNRGFTGHEHVDEMGLIHMNGRVYDPQLGRFLSADPTMQFPYASQGYNRYSYVQNNPLKYTDPSGYGLFGSLFKGIGKLFKSVTKFIKNNVMTLISMAIMAIPGPNTFAFAMAKGFAAGFIGSGGNLKAGIIGALSAGAFHYAGINFPGRFENAVAHGVIGGVRSVLMGGNFGSGFLSGAFGSFATPSGTNGFEFGGFVQAAVAGGIGSVLGGGKFENGAVTAAFGYAFNAAMSPKTYKLGIGVEAPMAGAGGPEGLNVGIDPGHTFSYAIDANGNIVGVISFGPSETIGMLNNKTYRNGELDGIADYPLHGDAKIREWTVSKDQFDSYMKAALKVTQTPPKYTPAYNCTSAAVKLLQGAGVNVPNGMGRVYYGDYSGNYSNPYHLLKQLGNTTTISTDRFR